MRLSQLLGPETVLTPLSAITADAALRELLSVLGAKRGLDVEMALRDVQARERAGSVLLRLGNRHAVIPHAMTNACKQLLMAVGTTRQGVPWGPTLDDQEPVHLVFLLVGPPPARALYLRLLSRLAKLCADTELVEALTNAESPAQFLQRLAAAEEPLGDITSVEGMPRFSVLGAGPGGMAMAAHLTLTGCSVNLFTRNPERILPLRGRGGIVVTGEIEGFARLKRVTTDMGEALADTDIVMVVVPATAHQNIARLIAPHVRDGQIIVLNPGRTCGAIEVAQILRAANPRVRPYVAEAQSLLYAARLTNPGQVHVFGIKNSVPLATLPAYEIPDVVPAIQAALPQFVPGDNVLKTSFDNIGAVFHPAITILNAARIEDTHGDFDYYIEGVTPSVASVLEAIDRERVAVAGALGIRVNTAREWLYLAYNAAGRTLLDAMRANAGYRDIKAPSRMEHRYISEDVPTSLVPTASIGEMLGVPTPTIRSIIHLASVMHGIDYWKEGRTVDRLGLAGKSVRDIRFLVVGAVPSKADAPMAAGLLASDRSRPIDDMDA